MYIYIYIHTYIHKSDELHALHTKHTHTHTCSSRACYCASCGVTGRHCKVHAAHVCPTGIKSGSSQRPG